jgi:hypothetical protein
MNDINFKSEEIEDEPKHIKTLDEKTADFHRRYFSGQLFIRELWESRIRGIQNPDGTVVLYHGTSFENLESIKSSKTFDGFSFFAPTIKNTPCGSCGAGEYAKMRKGEVFKINVDARDISFNRGSEEVEAKDGLIMGYDGVWRSPNRYLIKEEINNNIQESEDNNDTIIKSPKVIKEKKIIKKNKR